MEIAEKLHRVKHNGQQYWREETAYAVKWTTLTWQLLTKEENERLEEAYQDAEDEEKSEHYDFFASDYARLDDGTIDTRDER